MTRVTKKKKKPKRQKKGAKSEKSERKIYRSGEAKRIEKRIFGVREGRNSSFENAPTKKAAEGLDYQNFCVSKNSRFLRLNCCNPIILKKSPKSSDGQ